MNWGRWEKSKAIKRCDGCSNFIKIADKYLLAKFSLKDEGTNITRFFSINLCFRCVSDFEDSTKNTDEPDDAV